jgi:hypothetical protein
MIILKSGGSQNQEQQMLTLVSLLKLGDDFYLLQEIIQNEDPDGRRHGNKEKR